MQLKAYLKDKITLVNNALNNLLPDEKTEPFILHEAMRYSVFAGGKRLRPVLLLAAAEAVGKENEPYLSFACALELIHTYSLIHDDLPAMDDDDLRRGQPTCHKKFGEAHAILAGDALLTYAFNLQIKTRENGVSAENIIKAMDDVAWGSGMKGMIIGQVMDIESEDKEIDLEKLQLIHAHKTGALFCAAIRAGAILAEATEEQLNALTIYAEQMGLAFQITDDILDVVGDTAKLGKPVGSDIKNNKATYPALVGLDESRKLAQDAINKSLESLNIFGESAEPLRAIARYIIERES